MGKLTRTLRTFVAIAATGASVLGVASEASALAYGYAFIEVRDLKATFTDATTGTTIGFAAPFNFNSTISANVTGFAPSFGIDTVTAPFSCTFAGAGCINGAGGVSAVGPLDPKVGLFGAYSGVGAPGPVNNTFTPQGAAPNPYARADAIYTDTLINTKTVNAGPCNDPNDTSVGCLGLGAGGDWRNVSEATIGGMTGAGSGNVTSNQEWRFSVAPLTGTTLIHLEFDVDATSTVTNTSGGDTASASSSIGFQMQALTGGGGASESVGVAVNASQSGIGSQLVTESTIAGSVPSIINPGFRHVVLDFDVQAGSYSFVVTSPTSVLVTSVPAPASLILLGIGLIGAGAVTGLRRFRKAA